MFFPKKKILRDTLLQKERETLILFSSFHAILTDPEPEMARVSSLKLGRCSMHEKVVISLSVICSPAAAR